MLTHKVQMLAVGLLGGLSLGIAMLAGTILGTQLGPRGTTLEIPVQGVATDRSETMAIATGSIDGQTEGLYTLDCLTGDLQCAVLNPRNSRIGALFRTNVMKDLRIDGTKKPNFLMVTGTTNFVGGVGNVRPASSVVYVVDATTGRFVIYGVPWQRDMAARGAPQQAPLMLMDGGTARNIVIRDMD